MLILLIACQFLASHSERRPRPVGLHVGSLGDLTPFLSLLREIGPELLGRSAMNIDRELPQPALHRGILQALVRLSLSETKSGHIGGAIRQRSAAAECGRRSLWSGLAANPYSMRGACEFDCSSLRKIEVDAEDAAHQIRRHGQGIPAGSSR